MRIEKCEKTAMSKDGSHKFLRTVLMRGKQMRAYRCDKCFKWHVTSNVSNKYGNIMGYK